MPISYSAAQWAGLVLLLSIPVLSGCSVPSLDSSNGDVVGGESVCVN